MFGLNEIIFKEDCEKKRKLNKKLEVVFPNISSYQKNIPTNIFQTWQSKNLPPLMSKSVQNIIKLNPEFKYFLFDDIDCRNFIKKYFTPDVLYSYDKLIPGAYKADLWRYCVLFIHGGIYLDIKYNPLNGFKFINLIESEHLVADINNVYIYNALMVCKPKNSLLYNAIRKIVDNVKNNYYGENFLAPTGPALLCNFISTTDSIVDLKHQELEGDINYKIIYYMNIPILKSYDNHAFEARKYSRKKHYSKLWNQKKIYL